MAPDEATGFVSADINQDGDLDLMAGSYSRGPRDQDGAEVTPHDRLGRLAWFENPGDATQGWVRHDISRRKRGMFDKFVARDMDADGDMDFVGTRGNSVPLRRRLLAGTSSYPRRGSVVPTSAGD